MDMKNLPLAASILIAAIVIGGAVLFGKNTDTPTPAQNVTIEGDQQIIVVTAKGGYAPKLTTAKANTPTVLRVKTDGTYDCTASVNIPSLGISKVLEPTAVTEIVVPPQQAGSELKGTCAMGMYNFSIKFM